MKKQIEKKKKMPTTLATLELLPSASLSLRLATFSPHQRAAPHYTWKIPQHSLIRAAGSGATERGAARGLGQGGEVTAIVAFSAFIPPCCVSRALVLCVKLMRMFCELHATPQSNRQQHARRATGRGR